MRIELLRVLSKLPGAVLNLGEERFRSNLTETTGEKTRVVTDHHGRTARTRYQVGAMAAETTRTSEKVKVSAISARQPEVPNLKGLSGTATHCIVEA